MDLRNNTILITGGSSGIGLELAKQFAALGNTVIITGRDAARLANAKAAIPGLHTIPSDVSRTEAIAALFEKVTREFPKLNVLVNNAGIMRTVNLQKATDNLTSEIETNLSGPIRMVAKFLPFLKSQASAAIVNVSSGLAFVPLPTSPVYCATKAALHSYTQSLRIQLKRTNVKIFELAPPATDTPLLGDEFRSRDVEGISVMKVDEMVRATLRAMEKDQWEIRPGQSNQLKFMSRLAPEFILRQLSRPVEQMLDA